MVGRSLKLPLAQVCATLFDGSQVEFGSECLARCDATVKLFTAGPW
jgi:hypothetical protein